MMDRIIEYIPFLAMTQTGGRPQLNFSRIVEAVIIAIVAGGLSAYITVQKIELKLTYLEQKVDKIYTDVYAPKWERQ